MTDNPWIQIYDQIGKSAALEMLAEEAAELSAAASKAARVSRGENPARINWSEALSKLKEELFDVLNAAAVLDAGMHGALYWNKEKASTRKMQRWWKSLFEEEKA